MPRLLLSLLIALAACAPVPAPEETAEPPQALPGPVPTESDESLPEMCDAEDYRALIGTSIAATTLPASDELRAFGTNDIVTQDYIPTRTNVLYDTQGTIIRVYCG